MSRFRARHAGYKEKLNEVKWHLCYVLDHELTFTQWNRAQIADHLGTNESNVSRIMNKKVEELTFNQLFRYLSIIRPGFKFVVSPY